MRNKIRLLAFALSVSGVACAQTVDYSVVSVSEETGADFMKITKSSDYVCMPEIKRFGSKISWLTNRIIDISKDGKSVAFLSFRNDKTNIFMAHPTNPVEGCADANPKTVLPNDT